MSRRHTITLYDTAAAATTTTSIFFEDNLGKLAPER